MIRALLEDRKTQTRRILKNPEKVPYSVGQRLWVRETWDDSDAPPGEATYRATVEEDTGLYPDEIANITWKPSIFMPRWASRLTLVVTDVRVQRLQDINNEDAKAEGAHGDPIQAFANLWDSINGEGAWDANPFVVALTFEVHRCNIDKMEPAA